MANNYIAMKDDIPTDYNLGKRSKKSTNVLMDYLKDDDEFQIVEGGSIVERDSTQIVPVNKIRTKIHPMYFLILLHFLSSFLRICKRCHK